MKIAIGCDHGGYLLKRELIRYIKGKGHNIIDVGCPSAESCDYPKYGYRVAALVSRKIADRGVLICKSGIGHSIVANKVKGVRAALCNNVALAKSSRQHNEANVLVLGAQYTDAGLARRIVSAWLQAQPLGGRHSRRVRQIERMEAKLFSGKRSAGIRGDL